MLEECIKQQKLLLITYNWFFYFQFNMFVYFNIFNAYLRSYTNDFKCLSIIIAFSDATS